VREKQDILNGLVEWKFDAVNGEAHLNIFLNITSEKTHYLIFRKLIQLLKIITVYCKESETLFLQC